MKLFGKEFTFNGFDVFHKGNKPNKTDVGLGNVDNVKQYSASNKPTPADIGAEPAFAKNNAFNKNFGTAAGTVCQGNDSRLSDARTPKAHSHDDRYYTKAEVDAKITGASGNTMTIGTATPSNPKKNDIWI